LCGNHEISLLEALSSDDAFDRFVPKGLNTLRSYGLGRDSINRKALKAALPSAHRHFLEALPLTCRTRSHLFVHAGVRPGRPLKRQKVADLTTIRDPFFEGATGLPWTVVHGHTPTSGRPFVGGNRICIDTGACITGVLTAVAITEGEKPRFLSVSNDD